MKTAISIPDDVFELAEQVARRLGVSRSELYAKAVELYLKAHRSDGVTEKLNSVYAENPPAVDGVIAHLQAASLLREDW